MRKRTFAILGRILGVWLMMAGPAGAWTQPNVHHAGTPGPVAVVSFSMTRLGQIALNTRLTGAGKDAADGTFILDTGAGGSLISETLVTQLGLISQPAIGGDGQPLMSNGQSVRQVIVPDLTIGSLGVQRIPFLVVDDKTLSGISGEPVGGFLGGNLFANVAALLDFHARQVTFFDHGSVTPVDLKSVGMDGAKPLPLTHVPDSRWYTVAVQIQSDTKSATENLVVDTGCVTTVLSHASADETGLTGPMGWREHRTIATASGTLPVSNVMAPSVTPGGAEGAAALHGVVVAYPSGALPAGMAETLGLNVLSHYRALIDFPGLTLYLAPDSASTPPATGTQP